MHPAHRFAVHMPDNCGMESEETRPTGEWRITLPPPRRAAQILLALATIAAGIWLFVSAGSSMTPFVIGLALMYLLAPPVNLLSRFIRRPLAILLIYLVALLIFVLFFVFVIPPVVGQVQRLTENIPTVSGFQRWAADWVARYREFTPDALEPQIEQAIGSALPALQNNLSTIIRNAAGFLGGQIAQLVGVLSFVVGLLIIPIWLFYLLNDQRKSFAFVNRLLNFRARADVWNVWRVIDRSMSAFIRGQLTLGLFIGVVCGIGLGVLDLIPGIEVDYILLLAIWAGICELIPMIGALLGMIPAIVIAFAVGGPTSGIAVAILYIVIQQIENNVLVPRIIGESVGVHPAILTVMLIAMGSVFGLIGVIAAAPVTAIVRDLYLYCYRRLGGQTPEQAMYSISAPRIGAPA
jgi:predicted PurR-regulated permease PerM